MSLKGNLGQFYTTNCNYILENFEIDTNVKYIEPFVGQGDLVNWLKNKKIDNIETYDIDPKINCDDIRDSLLNPPIYENKYVVTNPPYLLRNKNKNKSIYDRYNTDDLYKAAILSFIEGSVIGGILIIPVNFLCGEDKKIKNKFFDKYKVDKCRIFEESVFEDTTYSVMALQFSLKNQSDFERFTIEFYPSKKLLEVTLEKKYGWRLGEHLFSSENTNYKFSRLTEDQLPNTNLKLYTIDSGGPNGRIRLEYDENHFFGKESDRTIATIVSNKPIEDERELVKKFNSKIEFYRDKYNSLFLSTYRNSTKNYMRKRISFKQAYKFLQNIMDEKI